ncbi:S9 family peptidase [Shewanella submarina]|uniref:Alpha/beta hydrolase family protein n=1 Tax=Shewanella submarina TaxID=2016376 RepID=A0ABV7GL26_9GAMM|nr:S9 family peptidase [Shewanella submarina]MCL1039639.1 S9 family peptidase [Shewanella submarina]
MHKITKLFAVMLAISGTQAQAENANLRLAEVFAKGSQFFNPKISPGGEYIGVESKVDGKDILAILDIKTLKPIHAVHFGERGQVGNFHWVNDDRLVVSKEYLKGWSDSPLYYGEMLATNVDGSRTSYVFGYNNQNMQTGSNIKRSTSIKATGFMLDPLHDNPKKMLVSAIHWDNSRTLDYDKAKYVYEVDVYNGKRKRVTKGPIGNTAFMTDHNGDVRFAMGRNANSDIKIFRWEDRDWVDTDNITGLDLNGFGPISFAESDQAIYAEASTNGEPRKILHIDLKTGKQTPIVSDESVEASNYWIDGATKKLYAVEFEDGYPTYAFVDKKNPKSQYLKKLLATLPGHQVRIVSENRDANKFLIHAFNDRNPGDFYLFTTDPVKLQYLFSSKKWLDPEQMAEVKPIEFKNREGHIIKGYLTLPANTEAKNLPMVVVPHGGPHGPRDWWQFDSENQLLAQKGFAVLQINFRGSGGYGDAFEQSGYLQWGTGIQHDIIDGTKYVIEQGIADADRMCISGGSFGGYSALQSSVIEPDMFKCAIGFAGVYDLPMMYEEGDVQERRSGVSYLQRAIGTDQAVLKSMSPTYNAHKIKAAVMLVHGGDDERAPIEQYEAMAEALKKANHPFQTLVMDDEGHGFYKDEHRAKYYAEMLAFLEQHLN